MSSGKNKYEFKLEDVDASQDPSSVTNKDILKGLGEHTTLHGISHCHRARGKVKNDCWITLTVLMTIAMAIHTGLVVWEFTKFEVDIGLKMTSDVQVDFPAVTVCNVNTITQTALSNSTLLNSLLTQNNSTGSGGGQTSATTSPTTSFTTSPTTSLTTKGKGKNKTPKNNNNGNANNNNGNANNNNNANAPVQQSFVLQQQMTSLLANIPALKKAAMGHKLRDFVLECSYAGRLCDISQFSTFFNPIYGNCFTFNSGWNSSFGIYETSRPGPVYGLSLTLNLEQSEYVADLTEIAGARMQVHHQDNMPFVEDEGRSLPPGETAYFGIRRTTIARMGWPYGSCLNPIKGGVYQSQISRDVFEETYPVRYSKSGCLKTCYQKNVISHCGCADPSYPMTGTALGVTSMTACDITNVQQSTCKADVVAMYEGNRLTCDCPTLCNQVVYSGELSSFMWPSIAATSDTNKRLAALRQSASDVVNDPDPDAYKYNFLQIKVFFLELNTETISEEPAYPFDQFQADFGGIMGLWLGASIMSLIEVGEALVDMCILSCRKRKMKNGKNKISNEHQEPARKSKTGGRSTMVSRATVSSVLVDLEDEEGADRGRSTSPLEPASRQSGYSTKRRPPSYNSIFVNKPLPNDTLGQTDRRWRVSRGAQKAQHSMGNW